MKVSASARARRHARMAIRSSALARSRSPFPSASSPALCVTGMTMIAEIAHVAIYGIAFDERLSAQARVSLPAALAALCGGGWCSG